MNKIGGAYAWAWPLRKIKGEVMDDIILKVNHLTKYFSMVKALDDISFDVRRGEVHALCGENGAGKSTFIKLLTGAYEPTKGNIEFEHQTYDRLTPRLAMDLGISVIYQEFSLIPYLTVAENIFYGRELQKAGIRNIKEMNRRALELCKEMGIELDINTRVMELGIAYQQIVEIMKAVSKNTKFIIMDEPTAPLTINETKIFFNIIRKLKEKKVTIVFISHRLEEVFELCDRATVFCDGKYMITKSVKELTKKELISYMVGRELSDDYPQNPEKTGEVLLEVKDLTNKKVSHVSFCLRKGEILGLGGLVGAGRTELARIIYGVDEKKSGTMICKGEKYEPRSPKDALLKGIGLIPEDRKQQGLVLGLPVGDNVVYSILDKCSKAKVLQKKKINEIVNQYVEELKIKTPDKNQLVKNLSGGNQQKVVLAKMLATNCDILIFDEPTRGIDVGAKQEIYTLMVKLAEQGKAIIMISSEMPELIGMSDRILVMSHGEISGELNREEYSQERILEFASSEKRGDQ